MNSKEQAFKNEIAQILRDNITFSPQAENYIIHGAIEKIWELLQRECERLRGERDDLVMGLRRLQSYCCHYVKNYTQTGRYREVEDTLSMFDHTVNPS